MNPRNLALLLNLLIISANLGAQLIRSDPDFPTVNDSVTITYDASQGNKGLMGFDGDVYAHAGVITSESSSPSDWKHAPSSWGDNSEKYRLNRIGTDLYQLAISPSIHDYYDIQEGETVEQLAFVFRSADNSREGKTAEGGDIFYRVYEPGLNVSIIKTDQRPLIVKPGETIDVEINAVDADSLILLVDNTIHTAIAGTAINTSLTAEADGQHWIKAIAKDSENQVSDSVYYFIKADVVIENLPPDVMEGINYINDSTVTLVLYAPGKKSVIVNGDFSGWSLSNEYQMKKTVSGDHFWLTIDDLEKEKEYIFQYLVDDTVLIGDPYAEKVSDPWNDKWISDEVYPELISYPEGKTTGIATVLQTGGESYSWSSTDFIPPENKDLIIYELLVRDFTREHSYASVIDTLPYLEKLGINAIELMPVNEFEGNNSWGYNPSYYFAADKYYGTKNELKRLIDSCHARGIAVIIDMVLNHSFGQSPLVRLYWDAANNSPQPWNRWFNPIAKHDYNVGYDMDHESLHTKAFSRRVMKFWLEEYLVDGFRFDLSKGFTQKNTLGDVGAWGQYDESRVAIWKEYADTIWNVNPDAYVILEHFADNTEEKELAEYGMMIWGNMNWDYSNAAKGTSSNLSWATSKQRGWDKPHLITYMESHDEERVLFRVLNEGGSSGDYNTRNLQTAIKRMELSTVFFLSIPGPKMIWQFGELGYDVSIDYNGRLGEKPERFAYYWDTDRKQLYQVYSHLTALRAQEEVFSTDDYSYSLSESTKSLHLNHSSMNVTVLGNFGLTERTIDPRFQQTGTWYEFFSGDSLEVSNINGGITLSPGEYRLYTSHRMDIPEFSLDNSPVRKPQPESRINVFPNPAYDDVSVEISTVGSEEITLGLYDITGKQILQTSALDSKTAAGNVNWDLSGLEPGIYFIRGRIGQELITRKLIKL